MPIFYPSVTCNFRLRFDEAFHLSAQPSPDSVSSLVSSGAGGKAVAPSVRPLVLQRSVDQGFNVGSGAVGAVGNRTAASQPSDNLSIVFNRAPTQAEVEIPGYRDAGRFTLTFPYRDLPIDPRLVRAVGVEIHMGTVSPDDFATGMVSMERDARGQLYRRSVLRTIDANGQPDESTLCMIGIVDTWHVKHTSKGSVATMDGRDLRGILLDSPADPKLFRKLDLKQPIDSVVRQILAKHPFGDRITVEVNPDDWTGTASEAFGPIGATGLGPEPSLPSPATVDGVTRVNQGTSGGQPDLKPAGAVDNVNFWDLITRYCFLVGAIPYFVGGGSGFDPDTGGQIMVGSRLRIRPAKSIYDQQKPTFDPRVKTPFAGGKVRKSPGDSPDTFTVRRMVYGRDIEDLTFERKYTGVKARVVQAIAIDTSGKDRGKQKLLTATWPATTSQTGTHGKRLLVKPLPSAAGARATSVSPSGAISAEDVLRIPVAGIRSQAQLEEVAKAVFEEIGRGEMGGSVTTKNLSSFLVPENPGDQLAGNRDPDLVRLRPGDAVEILVDRRQLSSVSPLVSTYIDSIRNDFDTEVAEVLSRMGLGSDVSQQNLARVIVASARGGIVELSRFFRVANVRFNFDTDRGITIAFDYQNYVEVRSGVTPSSGPNRSAPVAQAVRA